MLLYQALLILGGMEITSIDIITIFFNWFEPSNLCAKRRVCKQWNNTIKDLFIKDKEKMKAVPLQIKYLSAFDRIEKLKLWNSVENQDFITYLKSFTNLRKIDVRYFFDTSIRNIYLTQKIPFILGKYGMVVNGIYISFNRTYLLLTCYDNKYVCIPLCLDSELDTATLDNYNIKNIKIVANNRNKLIQILHEILSKHKMVKKISFGISDNDDDDDYDSGSDSGSDSDIEDNIYYLNNDLLADLEYLKKIEARDVMIFDENAFIPNLEAFKVYNPFYLNYTKKPFRNRISNMPQLRELKYMPVDMGLGSLENSGIKKIYYESYKLLDSGFCFKNLEAVGLNNICLITEPKVNFGFIHHQIFKFVKEIYISFTRDHNYDLNRAAFKKMFKNYGNFNIGKMKFVLHGWKIQQFVTLMVKNEMTFISNKKLKKITIHFNHPYRPYHRIEQDLIIPDKIGKTYNVYIAQLTKKKNIQKLILIRK